MSQPKLMIVIPCYNDGHYLVDAIQSVEEQPTPKIRDVIIVDDGSTDERTLRVLSELRDRGYHVIRQANQGLAAARNAAIRAARTDYVLPLDADNKVHENYLTTAIELLDRRPE